MAEQASPFPALRQRWQEEQEQGGQEEQEQGGEGEEEISFSREEGGEEEVSVRIPWPGGKEGQEWAGQ